MKQRDKKFFISREFYLWCVPSLSVETFAERLGVLDAVR